MSPTPAGSAPGAPGREPHELDEPIKQLEGRIKYYKDLPEFAHKDFDVKGQIEALEKELGQLRTKRAQSKPVPQQVQILDGKLAGKKKQIERHRETLKQKQGEIDALVAEMADVSAQQAKCEEAVRELEAERDKLVVTIPDVQKMGKEELLASVLKVLEPVLGGTDAYAAFVSDQLPKLVQSMVDKAAEGHGVL